MKRGDLVAILGDSEQLRAALIVQADAFDRHPSVTVLPLTADVYDTPLFRISVPVDPNTGLRREAQIMVDKATTVSRTRVTRRIGHLDGVTMEAVDEALRGFMGL